MFVHITFIYEARSLFPLSWGIERGRSISLARSEYDLANKSAPFLQLLSSYPEVRAQCRVDVVVCQYPIGIGTHTQVVHMNRNL